MRLAGQPTGYSINTTYTRWSSQARSQAEAGTPIGANDLWTACHALAIDAVLVSHNVREFRRIAGLRLEDWVEVGG